MNQQADWWKKPRTISIVVDNDSWILPYAEDLTASQEEAGDNVTLLRSYDDIPVGDVAFFLGCVGIATNDQLARSRRNLVVHESALPKGKGFAPVAWQILSGENTIPICLLDATDKPDAGNIIYQSKIDIDAHELMDEIRHKQGLATQALCRQFLAEEMPPEGISQEGEETFFKRRTPEDSRLDPDKSIVDQFNLLRVVDNKRYPAFFETEGHRYQITIEKVTEKKQS
jgi:methionyl-tRNA formyltransferase